MSFDNLKAKLSGKEEGYPVTEENIAAWIEMPKDEKVALIGEAKEKGGKWRESLLEIDNKAKEAIEMFLNEKKTNPDAGMADVEMAADKATKAAEASKYAEKQWGKEGEFGSAGPIRKAFVTAREKGKDYVGKAKEWAGENPKTATAAAAVPAALAAGLGAVALAKKMRKGKK